MSDSDDSSSDEVFFDEDFNEVYSSRFDQNTVRLFEEHGIDPWLANAFDEKFTGMEIVQLVEEEIPSDLVDPYCDDFEGVDPAFLIEQEILSKREIKLRRLFFYKDSPISRCINSLFVRSNESVDKWYQLLSNPRYDDNAVDTVVDIIKRVSLCSIPFQFDHLLPYLGSPDLLEIVKERMAHADLKPGGENNRVKSERVRKVLVHKPLEDIGARYEALVDRFEELGISYLRSYLKKRIFDEGGGLSLSPVSPVLTSLEDHIDDIIAVEYILKTEVDPELARRLSAVENRLGTRRKEDGSLDLRFADFGVKSESNELNEKIVSPMETLVERHPPKTIDFLLDFHYIMSDINDSYSNLATLKDYINFIASDGMARIIELFGEVNYPEKGQHVLNRKGLHTVIRDLCGRMMFSSFESYSELALEQSLRILGALEQSDYDANDFASFLVDCSERFDDWESIVEYVQRGKQETGCETLEELASMIGINIPKYTVVEKISMGGWSKGYMIIKGENTDKRFARFLKVPSQNVEGSKNELEHFGSLEGMIEEEEKISAQLDNRSMLKYGCHFNYLPIPSFKFSVDLDINGRKTKGLVYELIDGKNLRQLLEENPEGLDEGQFIDIATKAAYALNFVHNNFGPHNDVKPDNFMISSDGQFVYVLDLAFSRVHESQGSLRGSRHYTAPERLLGGVPPTENSDVYSFGVVLYELLTGKKPIYFTGTSEEKQKIAERVHDGEIKPVKIEGARFNTSILHEAIDLVMECLSPNFNVGGYDSPMDKIEFRLIDLRQRYATLEDLKNDLKGMD